MKDTNGENMFTVHLKGGDSLDAVSSFVISRLDDDGVITMKEVFKAFDWETGEYMIVTVPAENIEYTVEDYTDDTWERLLAVANLEVPVDAATTDVLFG
jgi:hypothetical protein